MRTPNTAPDITLEVPPFLRQQDAGGNSPSPRVYNCNFEKAFGQSRNGQKPIPPNKLSKNALVQGCARC